MNGRNEKIFNAIGYIDSDIIESAADALSGKKKYKKPVIIRSQMIVAAVIITLILAAVLVPILNFDAFFGNLNDPGGHGGEKNPMGGPNDGTTSPNDPNKDNTNDNLGDDTDSEPDNNPEGIPEEKCPECGNPLSECECEEGDGIYTSLECPTSSSVVYGKVTETNALKFSDVWGAWEVVSEGEYAGAVHSLPGRGACMIVINNVDFSKAKKITISADVMLPSRQDGNNNYGFVMDIWTDPDEDTFFYWETKFNSYYYVFQSGGGDTSTLIGKWGAGTVLGSEANGWTSFGEAHGVESFTPEGLEFQYGEWTNLKCVWDVENDALELYYDGQLTKKVDFDESTFKFTNEGDNACGLRANRDDVYFKNINLIVE